MRRHLGLALVFVLSVHGLCLADSVTPPPRDRRMVFDRVEPADRLIPPGLDRVLRNLSQTLRPEEWQKRYNAASAKKRRGLLMLFGGIGVMGGGVALMKHEEDLFDDCFNELSRTRRNGTCVEDVRPGALLTLSGAGVFVWGFFVRRDGGQDIEALEPQRPSAAGAEGPTAIAIGARSSVAVTIGARSAVDYHFKW